MAYGPIKIGNGNRVACFGNSIGSQGFVPYGNTGDQQWDPGLAKALNSYIFPRYHKMYDIYHNLRYKCTKAGTTGTAEPDWPYTIGEVVADGTAEFTCEASTFVPQVGAGYWGIAQAMSGQRLDEVFVVGASGETSDAILPYVDRADHAKIDIYYFGPMFENDIVNLSAAQVSSNWAALKSKINELRRNGKRIILQTCLTSGRIDSGVNAFTGYVAGEKTASILSLNDNIREFCISAPDVFLLDVFDVYVDPNYAHPVWPENETDFLSISGTGQALKYTDGVHPQGAGCFKLAKYVAQKLSQWFPEISHFEPNGNSQYFANCYNYGVSGAKAGASSGVVADLHTLNAAATGTAICSKETMDGSLSSWQKVAFDFSVGGEISFFEYTRTEPLTPGDITQIFTEVKVAANPVGLHSLYGYTRFGTALGNVDQRVELYPVSNASQYVGQFITEDTIFTLKSLKLPVPTGYQNVRNFLKAIVLPTGGVGVVEFGRRSLKKVG